MFDVMWKSSAQVILALFFLTACGSSAGTGSPLTTHPAEDQPAMTVTEQEMEVEPTPTPAQEEAPTSVEDGGTPSGAEPAPAFYFGVDLSYVNEMDDCGAVYLENGEPQDAFQLFNRHGANLVRARLWNDPSWTNYSTLPDVRRTFTRARAAGMSTILDFHYSDDWADPSKQPIPAAWKGMNDDELAQAVYDFTYEVLIDLNKSRLMPDFVQVGNEINSGILKQVPGLDWPRDARLLNAGIQAVRDAARDTNTNPKIILHVAQPENAGWWFSQALDNGVSDFDVIGLSYYPQWSSFTIPDLGAHVTYLRQTFHKDVMIVETAYPWTLDAVDETAANILNQGIRGYPFTIDGQRQYMIDLTQALISNGGLGVVYWEPAWVSADCFTRWGQGSHWENATFFDFHNNDELHRGVDFLSYDYQFPDQLPDGVIEDSYQEPLLQDAAGDNLEAVPHLDLLSLYGGQDEDSVYLALSIAGDMFDNPWGSYLIYLDTTQDDQGADIDPGIRPITVAEPYKPEFRLDISALDRKGTVSCTFTLDAWNGTEWQVATFTGGAACLNGTPSVVELQIPRSLLGNPDLINVGAVSTGRGRIHTAGDILGTSVSPETWDAPVLLDTFTEIPR